MGFVARSLHRSAFLASRNLLWTLLAFAAVGLALPPESTAEEPTARDLVQQAIAPQTVHTRLSRYVPVDLGVEENAIPADVRWMLAPLRQAAEAISC